MSIGLERIVTPFETLVARWRGAAHVVVLTGAGLSTASGIPDFRSPGGRWERYQPVPLPDFLAREEARSRVLALQGGDLEGDQSGAAQPGAPGARRPGSGRSPSSPGDAERRRPARAQRPAARAPDQRARHRLDRRVHALPPARAACRRAGDVGARRGGAAVCLRRSVEAGDDLFRPEPGRRRPAARDARGGRVRPLRRRRHLSGGRADQSDVRHGRGRPAPSPPSSPPRRLRSTTSPTPSSASRCRRSCRP